MPRSGSAAGAHRRTSVSGRRIGGFVACPLPLRRYAAMLRGNPSHGYPRVLQPFPHPAHPVRLGGRDPAGRHRLVGPVRRAPGPVLAAGLGCDRAGPGRRGHPPAPGAPGRRPTGCGGAEQPPAAPDRTAARCRRRVRPDRGGGARTAAGGGHRGFARQPAGEGQGAPQRSVRWPPALALEPAGALCHHPRPGAGHGAAR